MIDVVFDDILKQDVDAIVNPANRFMLHGGGLAGIIASAGGSELVKASQDQAPIDTGQAIITTAGRLPFKAVIHTVGPHWGEGKAEWRVNHPAEDPDELLARAHRSTMEVASDHKLASVAFPAVSCGVFRFPVERAAPIAIHAVREALDKGNAKVERVVFCLMDESHYQAFKEAAQ